MIWSLFMIIIDKYDWKREAEKDSGLGWERGRISRFQGDSEGGEEECQSDERTGLQSFVEMGSQGTEKVFSQLLRSTYQVCVLF